MSRALVDPLMCVDYTVKVVFLWHLSVFVSDFKIQTIFSFSIQIQHGIKGTFKGQWIRVCIVEAS